MTPLVKVAGEHYAAGDLLGAERRLQAAIASDPSDADAWGDLAIVASDQNKPAAEALARRALMALPGDSRLHNVLGVVLKQKYKYTEALTHLDTAVRTAKNDELRKDALINRALLRYEINELVDSEADFLAAMRLSSDQRWLSSIAKEMAYPVLALGDLRRGFALMEHRWGALSRTPVWDLGVPEWNGENLRGKTLLVHQDQGHGDVIQFCRFLNDKKFHDTSVTLAVYRPLVRFLRKNRLRVVDINGPLPVTDFHVPICSLPYHLGTNLDKVTGESYLIPGVSESLPYHDGLSVGLVWAAENRLSGPRRSLPLEKLLPLALFPGVKLYSLQYGPHSADVEQLGAASLITDLVPLIRDFADTAALMSQLDLVISADSASLHLAGALGIKCVGFSDHVPCWRWLRGRQDTPWYSSMQLISQEFPGNWDTVSAFIEHACQPT